MSNQAARKFRVYLKGRLIDLGRRRRETANPEEESSIDLAYAELLYIEQHIMPSLESDDDV